MSANWILSSFLFVLLIISSCTLDENPESTGIIDPLADLNLPESAYNYAEIELPDHYFSNDFPNNYPFQFAAIASDNTPADNPTTDAGALLGRVLFYEKKLSANETISCASCHKQENGFSDNAILSIGFEGGATRRHSMGLANARFYDSGRFFWDERAASLEEQVLMPFQDEVEMGMTLEEIVEKVKLQPYANTLFENAFGDDQINADRIAKALAQFVRSLVSVDSKYDQGRALVNAPLDEFPNFTDQENLGKQLFNSRSLVAPSCNSCHVSEAFIAPLLAPNASTSGTNNGLDAVLVDDFGIYETTGSNGHRGKFKVPSLKNIARRPPYMHDGRFDSLEEVIDHYSTGIQDHPTLQTFLRDENGDPVKYNFTTQEKAALVAFLNTLTDTEFIQDEKFSDPFK